MINDMAPPMQFPIVIDMHQFVAQTSSSVDPSSSHLAIVPYQPTLHAVLITLWAAALDNPEQHMEGTEWSSLPQ